MFIENLDTWSGQYYTGEISILDENHSKSEAPNKYSLMTQGTFLMNHLTVKNILFSFCSLIFRSLNNEKFNYDTLIEYLGLSKHQK